MAIEAPEPKLLKKVSIGDLTPEEKDELHRLSLAWGDLTIVGDKSTLETVYHLSLKAKNSHSVARRRLASWMERFVLSAAASRQLYYREYKQQERTETFGKKLAGQDELVEGRRKKRRSMGETTIIRKA
jgi:hypothetical protein